MRRFIIAVVGSRLRHLVGIIEELSFTTVSQRLIALIVRLAQASSTRTSDAVRVELNKTQQDLAAELGTVRELVSHNLGRLAEGYLHVDGRNIIVRNLAGLQRELESPQESRKNVVAVYAAALRARSTSRGNF